MTAVAAWNDDMAALVASSASRAGLVVPDQLAVMGAYDFPVATLVHPALSTVRVDLATRMQTIATAILTGLEGHPLTDTPVGNEQVTVVRRASTQTCAVHPCQVRPGSTNPGPRTDGVWSRTRPGGQESFTRGRRG
jgi:DNA-binding LacI/PurR family transcriptional regulator